MTNTLRIERDGRLATVVLNRPERMNALVDELMDALPGRLRELADDPEVRCVVLTGEGDRAFSAGADLQPGGAVDQVHEGEREETLEKSIDQLRGWEEASWLLHTMPKPTVASINGAVAGASLSMAMACDFRVAAANAVFSTAFARIGFSGDYGGAYFMTAILGTAKARELYLLSDRIDAREAERIGLVHRVFERETFRKEAEAFARRLADGSPLAHRYMKRNLNAALTHHLRDLLDMEAEAMMRTARSEDFQAAVHAFLAKRPPVFEGR